MKLLKDNQSSPNDLIPVGISSCLLGQKVRYDGGHMQSRLCAKKLSAHFQWIPTCPEMAIGMPSPRPAIHIAIKVGQERLVDSATHQTDYTQKIQSFSHNKMADFESLCGYVVAKSSPSCGMERVKVFKDEGDKKWHSAHKNGVGMFTNILMQTYPNLPVEEDGRLNDASLRDNFILRVFVYSKWMKLLTDKLSYHKLFEFHASVKYSLMAADYQTYQMIGRKLAQAAQHKSIPLDEFAQWYITILMQSLKKVVKRKAHRNVLQHLMGYFKKQLSRIEKQNLSQCIDDYCDGLSPLGVPIQLLKLYLAKYPNPYLDRQFYLFPYPQELATRDFL